MDAHNHSTLIFLFIYLKFTKLLCAIFLLLSCHFNGRNKISVRVIILPCKGYSEVIQKNELIEVCFH